MPTKTPIDTLLHSYMVHVVFCKLCPASECDREPILFKRLKEIMGWR